MSDEIYGQRFLDARGQTPWHRLGTVVNEDLNARQALTLMGSYAVTKEPIYLADGSLIPDTYQIVREATEDSERAFFGVVSDQYTLIDPEEFAAIWDTAVERPIETIGALKEGRLMFITTLLPTVDVKGDEVQNYLIAQNGMDGNYKAEVRVAGIRVVCWNTLTASARMASQAYHIRHDQYAKERLYTWLQDVYERGVAQAQALKEAYVAMAEHQTSQEEITTVLDQVYKEPPRPRTTAHEEVVKVRMKEWEQLRNRTIIHRSGVLELLDGKGTGLDTPAAQGTAWGLYNAIVESEDYRNGGTEEQAAWGAIFDGERLKRKQAAFSATLEIVR